MSVPTANATGASFDEGCESLLTPTKKVAEPSVTIMT